MANLFTNKANSLKDLYRDNNITVPPTDAAYNALSPGYTLMELRRTFGSKKRAHLYGINRARLTNPAPTVANALIDQEVEEAAVLSYQFAADSFADADDQTLTYSALLSSGAALPEWLTFTPATRTFSGTAPAFVGDATDVITVRVTVTDTFGSTVTDDFTITTTNIAPAVANALIDQNVEEAAVLSYQFASNSFSGDAPLTYTATLSNDDPLPGWLTFTAGTRTFSGTAPTFVGGAADIITVKVTATDPFEGSVSDEFTITVTDAP